MRAFRPSRFAPVDEYEEEHQLAKDANVEVYAKRAAAGMPLFDRPVAPGDAGGRSSQLRARD
jgi:hypothetical protein